MAAIKFLPVIDTSITICCRIKLTLGYLSQNAYFPIISCFPAVESLRECIQIVRAANCIKLVKPRCEELWVGDGRHTLAMKSTPRNSFQQSQRCCHMGLKVSSLGRRDKGPLHKKCLPDSAELPCKRNAWSHHPCTGAHMPDLGLNSC